MRADTDAHADAHGDAHTRTLRVPPSSGAQGPGRGACVAPDGGSPQAA